jgi:hypothetical protein
MGPSTRLFGSWVRGALGGGGSLPQFGRRLKRRSGLTWRHGHESFKAIRKFAGTGSASGAVTLASIWLAGHPCNLGALGSKLADGISCSSCCLFWDCPAGSKKFAEMGGVGVQTGSRHLPISNGNKNAPSPGRSKVAQCAEPYDESLLIIVGQSPLKYTKILERRLPAISSVREHCVPVFRSVLERPRRPSVMVYTSLPSRPSAS